MHKFCKTIGGIAAAALFGSVATLGIEAARAQMPANPAKAAKAFRDRAEHDLYSAIAAEVASNPAKALTDLDTWQQNYPASDFKDDRSVYYILALAAAKQPTRAVDEAAGLLNKDLNAAFDDPKSGPQMIVKALYTTVTAVQQIPNPTPEELATGRNAAQTLMYFNRKPEGTSDAAWAKARGDLQKAAKGALLYTAAKLGGAAMQRGDYAAAEAEFSKALQANPDSAVLAAQLGASQLKQPSKISLGLYEIARAVVLNPGKSDFPTPDARAQQANYLEKAYVQFHGGDDGLEQLKQQALSSPFPPFGFHIISTSDTSTQKVADLERSNPQLALWIKLRAVLAGANGPQYFETSLKGAMVPRLLGTLVGASPACRPDELLVAVPADAQQPRNAEITLKLDAPLGGNPKLGYRIQWEGVSTAFVQDPFMLTMAVAQATITGLAVDPCGPASAQKAAPSLGSVYTNAQDPADRLALNASDGSFSLEEGGQKFSGKYTVNGNVLILHIVELAKDVDIAIDGRKLMVNGNETWVQNSAVSCTADAGSLVCRDMTYDVSFRLPEGWSVETSWRWGDRESTVAFVDPQKTTGQTAPSLNYRPPPSSLPGTPEGIQAMLQRSAESKVNQRRGEGMPDYRLRSGSCQARMVGGQAARSCIAEYTGESGIPMAEYLTFVRTQNTSALFFGRIPAPALDSYRKRFDTIIETLQIP